MVGVRSCAAPEWQGYDGLTGNNSSVSKAGSEQNSCRLAKEYAGAFFEIGLLIETTPARP